MRVTDRFHAHLHPGHHGRRLTHSSRPARAAREATVPRPHPHAPGRAPETGWCRELVNALRREIDRLRGVDRPDPLERCRTEPPSPYPSPNLERMPYAVKPLAEPTRHEPLPDVPPPRFLVQREVITPRGSIIDVLG